MDLPELIKTCKTEQRAFDYLLNEIHRIKGIRCPSWAVLTITWWVRSGYDARSVEEIIPLFLELCYLVWKYPWYPSTFSFNYSNLKSVPGKLVHNWISVIQQHSKHSIYSEDQLPSTSLKTIISSKVKLRPMNHISEEDEKESVVAVPVIRQLYSGSWNVGERFQSVSSRMSKQNPWLMRPLKR